MTETTIRIQRLLNADFAYSVSDSSMIGARISPGDIVLVRLQDSVENGDIAVAYYNGEVRIGKYSKHRGCEALTPANCEYMTIVSNLDNPSFEIFGKVIGFMSTLGNGDDEAIREKTVGQ